MLSGNSAIGLTSTNSKLGAGGRTGCNLRCHI